MSEGDSLGFVSEAVSAPSDSVLAQSDRFFERLWCDYIAITPQAEKIEQSFMADGNKVDNDHVAFRTFDCQPINLLSLEPLLLQLGYYFFEEYFFADKHLRARAYLPVKGKGQERPRIFLSELLTDQLSASSSALIHQLCSSIAIDPLSPSIFYAPKLWPPIAWSQYQALLADSEYAAWLAVMGLRANHFTISINTLLKPDIDAVVNKLQREGYKMNCLGGVIKGAQGELLRQCSTLADSVDVTFACGAVHRVSSCYYEFAWRGLDSAGDLFQGFNPVNANKIFHSTDSQ